MMCLERDDDPASARNVSCCVERGGNFSWMMRVVVKYPNIIGTALEIKATSSTRKTPETANCRLDVSAEFDGRDQSGTRIENVVDARNPQCHRRKCVTTVFEGEVEIPE